MIALTEMDAVIPGPAQDWDYVVDVYASPADFAPFILDDAETLRAEGWRIEFAPKWPLDLTRADADSLQFQVDSSGIDWFDIGLGVRVDGQAMDILPYLRRLLAAVGPELLDSSDDFLTIPLAGNRAAALPMEKLRPVLAALLSLALDDPAPGARLKLSRLDMGALADLEAASGIVWAGAEQVRGLARRLAALAFEPTSPPASFTATMRPYQQTGLDWLQALHGAGFGALLADDMGLGKTVQALAHIATLKAAGHLRDPALIVAPTSVLPNWQDEIARFTPDLTCLTLHGSDRHAVRGEMTSHDIILTSYPILARDIHLLRQQRFGLAVLDEAHMLKNPKIAGFKAASQLQAGQTVALTGTPVENRLTDAWALMELVTPGLLGPLDRFTKTLRGPIEKTGDPAAKAHLARKLRPFLLRRTKDQVVHDLPPKTEIPEWIDLGPAQQTLYESVRVLMQQRVRDEIARVGLLRSQIVFLDALLKLRQICCDPRLMKTAPATAKAGPPPSAKLQRLLEMLPELIDEAGGCCCSASSPRCST